MNDLMKLLCVGALALSVGTCLGVHDEGSGEDDVTLDELGETARTGAAAIAAYLNGPESGYEASTYEAPPAQPFVEPSPTGGR